MRSYLHIVAIRIYLGGYTGVMPMADLRFADGVVETINWCDYEQHKLFKNYIDGYTLVYDERPKCSWEDWL